MLKNILKPLICFFKWHLEIFDIQKLRAKTANKYSVSVAVDNVKVEKFIAITNSIWIWAGIFYSFSSYIIFPIYIFLRYHFPSFPDIMFRLIEGHIFIFWAYAVMTLIQHATMEDGTKEYKDFYEKYKDFL